MPDWSMPRRDLSQRVLCDGRVPWNIGDIMASGKPIGDRLSEPVIRVNGRSSASSERCKQPLAVRYIRPQRLDKMVRDHETADIMVGYPQVYIRGEARRQERIVADRLGFKPEVDPPGLLNLGKMRTFIPRLPGASQ
jgi:hypothetical protein